MVFGGQEEYHMYALTEEGELIVDLSDDCHIPGYMSNGTYLIAERRVFALGNKLLEGKWRLKAHCFDGVEWALL